MSLLQKLLHRAPDNIPRGHKTAIQWAKEWDMSATWTKQLLTRGIEDGTVRCTKYKLRDSTGRLQKVPHYYEVKR